MYFPGKNMSVALRFRARGGKATLGCGQDRDSGGSIQRTLINMLFGGFQQVGYSHVRSSRETPTG